MGEENTPIFIQLPYIKSITFGKKIDPICKRLLWDICREKNIKCYDIELNMDDYKLTRRLLTDENFIYDLDKELGYVEFLSSQINDEFERIGELGKNIDESNLIASTEVIVSMLNNTVDVMINVCFFKKALNSICENEEEEFEQEGMPDNIITGIEQIDIFIKTVSESYTDIQKLMLLFQQYDIEKYIKVQKFLDEIYQLIEIYQKEEWNEICRK